MYHQNMIWDLIFGGLTPKAEKIGEIKAKCQKNGSENKSIYYLLIIFLLFILWKIRKKVSDVKHIVKRLFLIIPTLFGILLNFIIIQAAPGGPVEKAIAWPKGTEVSLQRDSHLLEENNLLIIIKIKAVIQQKANIEVPRN